MVKLIENRYNSIVKRANGIPEEVMCIGPLIKMCAKQSLSSG